MKTLTIAFLVALLPAALFGHSGTAIPGGNQTTPFVISKPGAYYLAANRIMMTKNDAVIKIAAAEVTLDLNGYSIGYPDIQGSGVGISVVGANVEVRNGSIATTPGAAIEAGAYSNNMGLRIRDVRVADSAGLYVRATSAWIESCHVIDTRGNAINLGYSGTVKDCVIRGVTKTNEPRSGLGIMMDDYGTVTGCVIDYTDRAGVFCTRYGLVKNNRVGLANFSKDPESAGIAALEGEYTTIASNIIIGAYAAGVRVAQKSIFTVLEDNVIMSTRPAGMQVGYGVVSNSPFTLIRGNIIRGNQGGVVSGPHTDGGNNQDH